MGNDVLPEAPTDALPAGAVETLMQAAALNDPEILKSKLREATKNKLDGIRILTAFAGRVQMEQPEAAERVKKAMEEVDSELVGLETRLGNVTNILAAKPAAVSVPQSPMLVGFSETVKNIPYIGGLIGSMIPTRFPSLARIWYTIQSTPALMGALIPGGGLATTILTFFGGNAPMKLLELDARDYLKDHYPDGSVNFQDITPSDFEAFKARKDQKPLTELLRTYIGHKRDERALSGTLQGFSIDVRLGDILQPETMKQSLDTTRKTIIDQDQMEKAKTYFNAATIDFAETTARTGNKLTLRKQDLKQDGTPLAGTPAETILKLSKSLTGADTMEVTLSGAPTIEWDENGRKIVRITNGTKVETALIEEILRKKNKDIDRIVIDAKPKFRDGIEVTYEGDGLGWVLHTPADHDILAGIPQFLSKDIGAIAEKDRKWTYTGSDFSLAAEKVNLTKES